MKYARSIVISIVVVAGGLVALATPAAATALGNKTVISNTDFASFGVGGMRGDGSGTIAVGEGISGTVTKALLYWNGPTNSGDPLVNAAVNFDETPITGTNIGTSSDNCWSFTNSQSYRADVTSVVNAHTGGPSGTYPLSGFRKTIGGSTPTVDADINGVSLVVFFSDGNAANNRDVTIVEGNDSNVAYADDSIGWDSTISGVDYVSGSTANLQLHVSDGQSYPDAQVDINGELFLQQDNNFEGDTVPGTFTGNGEGISGNLWDIKDYDITGFLEAGPNDLHLTSPYLNDCLSLVAALVDVPVNSSGTADFAAAFCPSTGCTISTDNGAPGATPGDPTVSTLDVPAGVDPQTITMRETLGSASTLCGGGPCQGQILTITSSLDPMTFSGIDDPTDPVVLTMIFDKSVKQGSQVYVQKATGAPKLVKNCTTTGVAAPRPCVSEKNILVAGGDRAFIILFLEGDPIIGKR